MRRGNPETPTSAPQPAGDAFLQALRQLNPDTTRGKLHVPDDAGRYRDALVAVMLRIPERWGHWISCSKGWYPLITQLDAQLAELDPDYELHQVKEKFGVLRYYAHSQRQGVSDRFNQLIRDAERSSAVICELCGAAGVLSANTRLVRTLCTACAATEGYGPIGELVDELTPGSSGIWRVSAAGAEHIWDLNRGMYFCAGGDGDNSRIVEVVSWPRVGSRFQLVYDHDESGEQPRISGVIESIERVG